MLEKITICNFKSYATETVIDFAKTNYTLLPQNVSSEGVLKGAIFVGANASGKSNIILAIKVLLDGLFSESRMNKGILYCLFGKNTKYSINYEFNIENEHIQYGFEVDARKKFIEEKLFYGNMLLMDRLGTSAKSYIADIYGVNYGEDDVDADTLFLRTLYFNTKFTTNAVLRKWMDFLSNSIYINAFEKRFAAYGKTDLNLKSYLSNDGLANINSFFDEYNFNQRVEFTHISRGEEYSITVGSNEENKEIFFKRELMNAPIPFSQESLGNQNLLRLLPAFLSVVANGGMLLIDEFSSGFHNDLEALLVRYFMEKSTDSQLIFVSHSTNLLSNSLLRPDQEYAVEFQQGVGSVVKRFSSEQPRSAQNIEKMYVSGVFGGLPNYREVTNENK